VPSPSRTNEAFREWTRGVSFTLSMGKTQVATLVAIHASQELVGHIGARHKHVCALLKCAGAEPGDPK
jgi:hypothetical protein